MMQNLTIVQALLISLFYWFKGSRLGYTFGVYTIFSPLPASLWVGIILGDIPTAMIVGGSLQLMYLGLLAPGGAVPSDPTVAALVATTVSIVSGMDTKAAVALAVPVGLLGVQLQNIEYMVNGFLGRYSDKKVEEGDVKGLFRTAIILPNLAKVFIYSLPLFLALYFGVSHVASLMEMIPERLINGLSLAGAMLPALGFAIIVGQIGKKQLLPYFLAGYFLIQYSGIPTAALALAGVFLAYLHVIFTANKVKEV
ncbi:PTS system, D-glucosaminate-specific IIC component [Enterococcus sp. DIV0098]